MKAMLLKKCTPIDGRSFPLEMQEIPLPTPGNLEVLIKITTCGVCHTEIDEIEGRTPPAFFPIILGHQIIGNIIEEGCQIKQSRIGQRVGVAWIFSSCQQCEFCNSGRENLCREFKATGRDANGGYAEYIIAPEENVFTIPNFYSDSEAAPLLCAGAIGKRAIDLSGLINGQNLGLMGFGASAHLVLKIVLKSIPATQIFVFSRTEEQRKFAEQLGAIWTGDIWEKPTKKLHCIIDTTPAWSPVLMSLENLERGGRLVINAIRKEKIDKNILLQLSFEKHLWLEKEIKSVANITGNDVREFFEFAASNKIKPRYQEYRLEEANKALFDLKFRKFTGAKVLRISKPN